MIDIINLDKTDNITRVGDHVTGRILFPQVSYGHTEISIDYRSVRPDHPDRSTAGATSTASDQRTDQRVAIVKQYQRLIKDCPNSAKIAIAKQVCDHVIGIRCSVRTLQSWVQKYDLGGPGALRENYVRPIGKVLTMTLATAKASVHICAWWAYRIGNMQAIDNKHMALAAGLIDDGYQLADVIAVIECYYGYKTDRRRYPFKTFARFVQYDWLKWLFRAAESNDRLRAFVAASNARRSLPPAAKMRRRQVNHRPTQQSIRSLSSDVDSVPTGAATQHSCSDDAKLAQAARTMGRAGAGALANAMVNTIDTGIVPIAATENPRTIAESLAVMEDAQRSVILSAAGGDATAFNHAVATLQLWWPSVPDSIRNNIDFIVNHEISQRPQLSSFADRRRLSRLLPHIKQHRAGCQQIGVAARLPA